MSENKIETRTVLVSEYKEVSVEELRAKANAFESEPYGADEVIEEGSSTQPCDHKKTTVQDNITITSKCEQRATHYYAIGEIPQYCKDHAREVGCEMAARFRRAYRL